MMSCSLCLIKYPHRNLHQKKTTATVECRTLLKHWWHEQVKRGSRYQDVMEAGGDFFFIAH